MKFAYVFIESFDSIARYVYHRYENIWSSLAVLNEPSNQNLKKKKKQTTTTNTEEPKNWKSSLQYLPKIFYIYIREHSQSLTQTAQTQKINWNIEA